MTIAGRGSLPSFLQLEIEITLSIVSTTKSKFLFFISLMFSFLLVWLFGIAPFFKWFLVSTNKIELNWIAG
jgi:hypothetical protein